MSTLIQSVTKVYGALLHLFPREFQHEFSEEMEDVFAASLEEGSKAGTALVIRACFFELFDLPGNLVVEHLSTLRKGSVMKSMSFEVGRSRAVLMAALGMSVGWVLINWGGEHFQFIRPFEMLPLPMLVFSLPVILCGLMLGIAAGLGRRAFLRIGLWTVVGGMLGHLVTLPVRMVNSAIFHKVVTLPQREYEMIELLGLVAVMGIYGFFNGAGLGFAFGGWKACIRFALIGLVAYVVGILAGYYISFPMNSLISALLLLHPLGLHVSYVNISYVTWGVMGALAGGSLGWFFGKGKQSRADPVTQAGNA
jgi:hypothetical protein